jgi:hypothetical protein
LVENIEGSMQKWWDEEENLKKYLRKLKTISKNSIEELTQSQILGEEGPDYIVKAINVSTSKS